MKLTFLGGADEVGASCSLVEAAGARILVDCGIRPSARAAAGLEPDQLADLSLIENSGQGRLDAVVVTHAHTDHTGGLELIVQRYPGVPVYATAPTLALIRILHQDARRIMQNRLDEEGELPLFDDIAVQRLLDQAVAVAFKTRVEIAAGVALTFFPAGHIAGAAMAGLESSEGNLLFSGDISISPQRTVDGARLPAFSPDVLILESTYGGKLHANRAVQERRLVEMVAQVTADGGKVLIPAFALGRAQEILLTLAEYQRRNSLPSVPIWVDGMVRAVCQAYTSFSDVLPLALQERGAQFFSETIRPVATQEQRGSLIMEPGPAVIISSSGMLAGGPSVLYARELAKQEQNSILLTGYQDEESPGRRLQELAERGSGSIRLGGSKVDVRCRVATYALSAHADEAQLVSLVEALAPRHVVLVHGEEQARASLEQAISARKRIVHTPRAGQVLTLTFERNSRLAANSGANPQASQAALRRQRREMMDRFAGAEGKWVSLQGKNPITARCLAVVDDHLWVEVAPGLEQAVYPEEVLSIQDAAPEVQKPAEAPLSAGTAAFMEPNQALSVANRLFPPEARLRKAGYSLDARVLTLTFDFPDMGRRRYSSLIEELARRTGWQVDVNGEANQGALNALAREVLPESWRLVKGPAIHREQKRLAITVSRPAGDTTVLEEIAARFSAASGWELSLSESAPTAAEMPSTRRTGKVMEINEAFNYIKSALVGSTLYRTSLKDGVIVLSFISAQVAQRYREQIEKLSAETGWALTVNPQPNQGAILEIAQKLLAQRGLGVTRGPSIFLGRSEVSVVLAEVPDEPMRADLQRAFEKETGFDLVLNQAAVEHFPGRQAQPAEKGIEIPTAKIKLSSYQQSLALDPGKQEQAVERARRLGISPPVKVRRLRDGYLLLDGLYRLRAALALGLDRIPAVIEE